MNVNRPHNLRCKFEKFLAPGLTLWLWPTWVCWRSMGQQGEPTRDRLNRSQRYDPLLDIMRHRSIQSFTIVGSQDFSKRSGIQSRNDDFSNLRHLDLSQPKDILGIMCLVAKAPNLSSLALGTNTGYTLDGLTSENDSLVQAYNAVVEDQTCPILFKEWNLRVSPLPREPNRSPV